MPKNHKKPSILILNSSTFGRHFPEHRARLTEIGTVSRVDVPNSIRDEELVEKLAGANAIIASVTPKIPGRVMEQLPELVLIARHGIGCDNVDLDSATNLGILVSKVDGILEQEAVAEHAVALMLGVGRHLHSGYTSVRESKWSDRAHYVAMELKGKRVGIIGIGNIGSRVAEILSLGFRSEVVAQDPLLSEEEIRRRHAKPVSLEELISTSDVISFHCPLTSGTKRMLDKTAFGKLKKGVLLINTCRGELIDETALCDALERGTVGAYGTDVVEGEPIAGDHRLLKYKNVLIVPHLGGFTTESLKGMGETMVKDVERVFEKGELPGVLANPAVAQRKHRSWG